MRIGVVGAGIAGLVLARQVAAQGFEAVAWEAAPRVGGQLRTRTLFGLGVDVGAEAVHLAVPQVAALVTELGLADQLVPARAGASRLLTRHGLRPLPAGVGPTGPTRIAPVLGSGILTLPGLLRAGLEPALARRHRVTHDVSVGSFIRQRFGDEVAEQFVDPLLGNLHSGDIDRLSLQSTAPQLLARAGRSLLPRPRLRRPGTAPGLTARPGFASLPDGLASLTTALAEGRDVRLGSPVRSITAHRGGWLVRTDDGDEPVDGLALACPAAVAGALLAPALPGVDADLARGRTADVATIVIAYPADHGCALLEQANGLLLRSNAQYLVKAMTNLGRKWPHLHHPDVHLVRASVGRVGQHRLADLDDDGLVRQVTRELHELAGLPTHHLGSHVERWPAAMPQLEVGHRDRMDAIRRALAGLPPIVLVGAPYDGLGIGSVVRSANAQAQALARALDPTAQQPASQEAA